MGSKAVTRSVDKTHAGAINCAIARYMPCSNGVTLAVPISKQNVRVNEVKKFANSLSLSTGLCDHYQEHMQQ